MFLTQRKKLKRWSRLFMTCVKNYPYWVGIRQVKFPKSIKKLLV